MDVRQDLNYGAYWFRRANRTIFKVKRASERVNPPVCQFSCAIVNGCFGDPDFQRYFCQNFSWTSVTTLAIEPVVHGFFNDPNFRRNFCQNFSWTSVKTLAMELVGHDGNIGPFSRLNQPRSG
ncbi:hypothetical protein H5410_058954 [Solanum commersonii]|uniref:Uncharacterized protein n=1 Tax=Solanum commersonii TaxID=4109 RepID=A0A9J5W1I2_SOLCO|nr:hypothetical protein H5410_058954 [Solanum commersonii]